MGVVWGGYEAGKKLVLILLEAGMCRNKAAIFGAGMRIVRGW